MTIVDVAKRARKAASSLMNISEATRVKALEGMALRLGINKDSILEANAKDIELAQGLSKAMIDRLTLDEGSIKSLTDMCISVARQPKVVGVFSDEQTRPNGILVLKQRIPIGVIGMIFESRPNVVIDGAALAIKSGNAIILKGGKEAQNTNRVLFSIIEESIAGILPEGSVNLVETREDVDELLKLGQYIDLMVPRGGSALVEHVRTHATMPVVAHDKGLCHLYVHSDAQDVIPIVLNGKTQRPGVCNALESLVLNEGYVGNKDVVDALINEGVEVRGCTKTMELNNKVKPASEADFDTEYLDKIISVIIVPSVDAAIGHIQKHSSHHTEAVLTQDTKVIEKFMNSLDSSAIMINTSTRFNDGGELGLGAELGISTSKLHAYGPMGAKEMTTTRFIVKGNGQVR